FAAHWKYKIGEGEEESELAVWLQTIEDILKNPEPNALDFLDTIKLNLFAAEIVVFTPKGETITLPKDSSVLDMAFTLHTEIGTHCIAAKVNHNLVPISHKLASGDQVEIITSKSQQPKPEWEKCLVTAKGKNRLRAALRHDRRVIIDRGEQMFNEFLLSNELTSSNETLTRVIALNKVQNKEELFFKIGNNEIALTQQLLKQLKPGGFFNKWLHLGGKPKEDESAETSKIDTKKVYELKTVDGKPNYKLANCCHPIPGDDVLGYINNRNEVVVHKMDCPMATRFKIGEGNRLVQTKWEDTSQKFLVTMRVEGLDRMGILQEIIYLISTYLAIDMRRLNIKANEGVFDCELDVLVEDKEVVNKLCKRLKRVKGVSSVVRIS
ncbi:MAG: bifunctional (p)ppGpp synthetase/guanosine-3',5'-bis(diphosphate) 3'-pyrophosphohydrolase, partial [Muribaculaceae bacterium]|nr:bifunctional (p)ppGpp synthetase/guanosine-3',5'-bis(diphosphate) 3'-pyrophosphohydrolase [Muribaculaceae bacterium]